MELHSGDECQKHWRNRFADQLDEAQRQTWGSEADDNSERAGWFREGIRYASMIIRWDSDDEADDQS